MYKEILSKWPTLISYCIENHNPRVLQWWESSRPTGSQDKEINLWLDVEQTEEQNDAIKTQ